MTLKIIRDQPAFGKSSNSSTYLLTALKWPVDTDVASPQPPTPVLIWSWSQLLLPGFVPTERNLINYWSHSNVFQCSWKVDDGRAGLEHGSLQPTIPMTLKRSLVPETFLKQAVSEGNKGELLSSVSNRPIRGLAGVADTHRAACQPSFM